MSSKSLKATVNLGAAQVEDAIVYLTDRYLKATKTTCRVVLTPTDYCLVDICKPLIERWLNDHVKYAKGKITVIFRYGLLAPTADMLIYSPETGDRFLYAKPQESETEPLSEAQLPLTLDKADPAVAPSESLLHQLLDRQNALETKLEQWFTSDQADQADHATGDHATGDRQAASTQPFASTQPSEIPPSADEPAHQPPDQGKSPFSASPSSPNVPESWPTSLVEKWMQPLKDHITHQIRDNLAAALHPLMLRLGDLQEQLADLTNRIDELEDLSLSDDELPIPQSQDEWLERIEQTWGTVGDYERYSSIYRDANAETPLCDPPDWVSLCELDWAQDLCPTLKQLHTLIHSPVGIGYEGADILQQFGQHIDPKTGDVYYVYSQGGFSAYETLQQLADNPDRSWLPELKNLWANLRRADHDIFQMFGWEEEAILALQAIIAPSQGQGSYGYNHSPYGSPSTGFSLKDYRAILNLGPFTPITIEGVRRAYHAAMKAAHPDSGGSTAYAQQVNEAYEAMMHHYFPETS
ncbi:MAG: hypothetical protein WBA57_25035 [Elainellaceae cyanobacterium]